MKRASASADSRPAPQERAFSDDSIIRVMTTTYHACRSGREGFHFFLEAIVELLEAFEFFF